MADDPVTRAAIIKTDPDPSEATRELVTDKIASLKDFITARLDAIERAAATFHEDLVRFPTTLDKAVTQARDYSDAQILRVTERTAANQEVDNQKFISAGQARDMIGASLNDRIEAVRSIVTADKVESLNYREVIAEQTRKNSTDVDAAVKAAFAASTLAVTQQNIANALASDKQGAAFTKDIEKLTVSLAQIQKSSDDKLEEVRKNNDQRVNDMKDRIGQIEARTSVSDPATNRSLQAMATELARLSMGAAQGVGATQQKSDSSAWIFSIVAVALAVGTIVVDALWLHNSIVK